MRCPECSQQKTQVRTLQSMTVEPIATYVFLALNVMIFVGVSSNPALELDLGLIASAYGPEGTLIGVGQGEWWRLITSGFLHTELFHLGLNMLALFWLGRMIEPALGHARFVGIYFVSLLAGSFGALLLDPDALTRGASGAIYGLLGAAIVMARNRNIDLMRSGLLPILGFNLVFTFVIGGISIGGHIGGLVGGLVTTYVIEELSRRRRNSTPIAVGICAVLAVAIGVATVAMA